MHEKKKRIIEESMKLFAEKGFHATSIQEIAKKSEVSKGAFYLYFDSKENLTVSIFEYYTNLVFEKMEHIRKQDIEPKQKLMEQIQLFLEMLRDHKEYIIMHFRDNLQLGKQMDELVLRLNKAAFKWISGALTEIYGADLEPYIVDASIQFDGMLQGYFKWLFLHDIQFNAKELATFIVNRYDDMAKAMIVSGEPTQIKLEQLNYQALQNASPDEVKSILDHLRESIEQLDISLEEKQQLREAADVIDSERVKKQPKKIIMQGMLAHLQHEPALQEPCKKIAALLDITLLSQE
ncbi:TetR/AcrR family transcriptional regulator [Aquibacillus koreensis]|uniref:TetR/AcrR family transcriptional regulator n=1 Tax=Aquibacillus koreensis TaxID=279446 RepID=A0A9X4AIU4_9BACI|nr:TetR/AcrR family transcriptional regulator [Aquibacillus koreensis]MCT2535112.1 TetR/AcrR family transcriptional regulator [Aquibacillus koreensis]MDC3419755.1 TetR/AcrR family transcriptional regulator [Aquibacillus koreensis]